MGKREIIFRIIDRVYVRALTNKFFFFKKDALYHPVKIKSNDVRAKRKEGSFERLKLIESIIGKTTSSFLDIGSAEGFFSIELAKKGNFVTALEGKKQRALIGQITARIEGITNCSFYNCNLDIEMAKNLPVFDNVLCLAVWHHWVRLKDLDYANDLLKIIWGKTNQRMFFETGLTELPEEFNLKGKDEKWLIDNLNSVFGDAQITKIGESSSFSSETFLQSSTKHDADDFKRIFYLIER